MTPLSTRIPGASDNWVTVALLVAAREIRANVQNYKIASCLAVMTLLFLLSAHLMANNYKQRLDNWTVNQTVQRETLAGGVVQYALPGGTFFHSAGRSQPAPIQQPLPLSVLVQGMERTVDRPVYVGQKLGFRPSQDRNSASALFDSPDALFIIKVLVSLFALFFSVDAVTREKEAGTLRALLSHPIRRRQLLLGKAAGASFSLVLPFAIAQFSAIAYLYAVQGLVRQSDELMRALLVFGGGVLYGLVFVQLGLFISTISTRTKSAAVAALLAWGMLVLALPDATVLAAEIVSPAPTYNHLEARLYEEQQRIIQEELRAHPGAKSIFGIPGAREAVLRAIEADRQLTDDYLAHKWSQIDRARTFAVISPAGALTFGLSDLAGTGASEFKSYLGFLREGRDMAVEALQRRWDLPPERAGREVQETLDKVKGRQRQPETLAVGLRAALPAMASLAIWALLIALAAFRRFDHYDVR